MHSNLAPKFWNGWGGDLATCMEDVVNKAEDVNDRIEIRNTAIKLLGAVNEGTFTISDLKADCDAIKLADLFKNMKVSEALDIYYNKYYLKRFNYLLEDITSSPYSISEELLSTVIYNLMNSLEANAPALGVMSKFAPIAKGNELVKREVCNLFAEYILKNLSN